MSEKAKIVAALGEHRLLLPPLINEALAANDRAKYRLTLLQTAKARADAPEQTFPDLRSERLASGIADPSYDSLVAGCVRRPGDRYLLPLAPILCAALHADLEAMAAPLEASGKKEAESFRRRLQALAGQLSCDTEGCLSGERIAALCSGDPGRGDSVHLLVMDLHKALLRLQGEIATENVEGALTYGLRAEERSLVAAFMKGVKRTQPLKFEHPGLGTTASASEGRLTIQNDIGTTDAHVLVVHVEGKLITLTYTDNHLPRLLFFQGLFSGWEVEWGDVQSRTDQAFEGGVYHLCLGSYRAQDKADLKAYLSHLGSRLVFLIDWNRARKRLQTLVPRQSVLELLSWAASREVGHMAFLKAGGERMIFDALKFVAGGTLSYGVTLDELLGRETAESFLKFIMESCTQGLLKNRPLALIRDEARVELYKHFHSAQQYLLDLVGEHAALALEIAAGIRDGLLVVCQPEARQRFERTGQRAKEWERRADELVISARELATQSEQADAVRQLLEVADDIPDELEEAAFHFTLLTGDELAEEIRLPLATLAELLVEGMQEYLKAVENARGIQGSGSPDEMRDFLRSVHRLVAIEKQCDIAQREVRTALVSAAADYRQAFVIAECAKKLESASDTLMHTGMILRDHILGKLMGPV